MPEQVRSAAIERLNKLGRMLRAQLGRFVIWPLLLLVTAVLGVWIFLESPSSVYFARDHVLPRVNELLPGTIQVGLWDGALANRLVLEDVEILDERGRTAIRAERVEVDWDAWALLSGRIEVDRLRVVRPEVLVEVRAEGGVNLAAAFVAPRDEPRPPRESGDGPKLKIAVRDIGLFEGQVRVETPSAEPVELRGIQLLGAWSMRGLHEDLALRELSAELVSPIGLPPVTLVGGVQLDRLDLSTDDLAINWTGGDRLVVSGPLGPANALAPQLHVLVERFDLAHIDRFASGATLGGVVAADLRLGGSLAEGLELAGELSLDDVARLDLRDLQLRLPTGEQPLEHSIDVGVAGLELPALLPGVSGLPPSLDFDLSWAGAGTSLENLRGSLRLDGRPFELAGLRLGALGLDAELDGSLVQLGALELAFAGGRVHAGGSVDVLERHFQLDCDGLIGDLSQLRPLVGESLGGGSLGFEGFFRGSWGGDGPFAASVHSQLEAEARDLRLGSLRTSRADLDWKLDVDLAPTGLPLARGTAQLEARQLYSGAAEQLRGLRVAAVLQGTQVRSHVRASRGTELLGDTSLRVDWSELPVLVVRGEETRLLAGDQVIEQAGGFELVSRPGRLELESLVLEAGSGVLSVEGSFAPSSGELDAGLRLRSMELEEVQSLVAAVLPDSGPAVEGKFGGRIKEIAVRARGSLASPALELGVSLRDFSVGGRPGQDVDVDLRSSEGNLSGRLEVSELAQLRLGEVPLTLRLDGQASAVELAENGAWDVELEIERNDLADLAPRIGIELPELVEGGTYTGELVWGGTTAVPELRFRLSLSGVRVAERDLNAQLGLEVAEGRLELSGSRLKTASEGTILSLRGGAGAPIGEFLLSQLGPQELRTKDPVPFLNELDLEAAVQKVDMSLVHLFAPALRPLTGSLRGQVALGGELAEPGVDLDLQLVGARAGPHDLKPVMLTADLERGALSGGFLVLPQRGGSLRADVAASMPLSLFPPSPLEESLGQPDLDVALTGEGFPLPVLLAFVPDIWESSGELTLQGGIRGSLLSPVPDLELVVEGGRVCYQRTGICYEELIVAAEVDTEQLTLWDLSFETVPQIVNPIDLVRGRGLQAGGQRSGLTAGGRVALDGLSPRDVEIDVKLERMWASYTEQMQAQVDGSLALRGSFPALDLQGELDLQNVSVRLGQEDVDRNLEPLALPPNLVVHRTNSRRGPGERPSVVVVEEETTLLDHLQAESNAAVLVRLTNNVRVELSYGLAEQTGAGEVFNLLGNVKPSLMLGGEVTLGLKGGKPELVGQITIERGSELTVLTKKFAMKEEGSVTFVGKIPDSQLDIQAIHPSRYGDVAVVVTGRLASPHIEFQSDELEDQADMMSVLLTGKPLSELTTAEGSAATAAIASALGGFTTSVFGRFVPVDSLNFDVGDDISSGSVEAGKAITPFIFFIARYRWGVADDENRVEGELEIRLSRRGYVEFRIGDRLEGAAEVVWKILF